MTYSPPYLHPARRWGSAGPLYEDYCDLHGVTQFAKRTGKCARCSKTPRAAARALGEWTYEDTCSTHGVTTHGTQHGVCLKCKTSAGKPRAAVGRAVDPFRAAARRAGSPHYIKSCPTHGPARHSTSRGKCLTCYNAQGYLRPAMRCVTVASS